MALFSERTESCGKKVLDRAGVVREAIFRQQSRHVENFADEQSTLT
jgi:hypothetical protein